MAVSSGEGKTAGQEDPVRRESARQRAGEQGLLFDDAPATLPGDIGYRGPTACSAAGITYRQLDYWARTGLVEPTIRDAAAVREMAKVMADRGGIGVSGGTVAQDVACAEAAAEVWRTG
ncbi:hypothetical protein AB0K48_49700, partial [Nonomuraea sp. NPDC055795]